MSRERINLFNLVMIILMMLAFRLHFNFMAGIFTGALFVGCMVVVYKDFKAIKELGDDE